MIQLLYCIFLGFWRRLFGGGFKYPVIKYRLVQHIIGFLAAVGICWYNGYHWIQCLLFAGVLQGLYWARSHGCCFDFGRGQPPDIKRYDQLWYWKYVRKLIPEKEWYGEQCDFILMAVRYTLPAILCGAILLNVPMIFMGVVLSCVYALMWDMHDWWGLKGPTSTSEYIVGFTTGLFIAF